MRNPAEISLRGVPHSAALVRFVGEEGRKLDQICDRIGACHVAIERLPRDKREGAQFSVRLNVSLPGKEFVVNREHDNDLYLAVRDAFAAASRQLQEQMRRIGASEPGGGDQRGNRHQLHKSAPGRGG
jgi:ribosome-associated translation inhibitor RaiA